MTCDYIDVHKEAHGVEPICRTLRDAGVEIAPSTYYAAKSRPPSARSVRDRELTEKIRRVHKTNYSVYGARKIHRALVRDGIPVGRFRVERLMRSAGLRGVRKGRAPVTTTPAKTPDHRPDLVKRRFTADRPDRLWVADITYIKTHAGWVYAAFVQDVYSRRIVGWQTSRSLRTDLALDALEMGLWRRRADRREVSGLVHHSDRGVQYVAIRYTERLREAEAVASVGTVGDSYDNAMAESFNSLYKAELIHNQGPWTGLDQVEFATMGYIEWYNTHRIHGELRYRTPVEAEQDYYNHHTAATAA